MSLTTRETPFVEREPPLRQQRCVPCSTGDRLGARDVKAHLRQVPGWKLHGDRIRRDLAFRDFDAAIGFLDRVAAIAKDEDHHPDLHLTDYSKVRIELTTHQAKGLTRNDFILADKIAALEAGRPGRRRAAEALR